MCASRVEVLCDWKTEEGKRYVDHRVCGYCRTALRPHPAPPSTTTHAPRGTYTIVVTLPVFQVVNVPLKLLDWNIDSMSVTCGGVGGER